MDCIKLFIFEWEDIMRKCLRCDEVMIEDYMLKTENITSTALVVLGKGSGVFSLNFEMFIPEDDSARLLNHILEGLDYSTLYKAYSSLVGILQFNLNFYLK
jgi:hypothetical protein